MDRFCYWTVADGLYADMATSTIRSARIAGVTEDFHVWSNRTIPGAVSHPAGDFDKWGCLFKLTVLRDAVQSLDYDYYIWFDTDTYFIRNPGNILGALHESPLHIALECNVLSPLNQRWGWWGCSISKYAEMMRAMGVKSDDLYNVNGGLFIVRRDAVESVFDLAMKFYTFCIDQSHRFVDEPLLAYAMHMLCPDLRKHTLRATSDLWATDWKGVFQDRIPSGEPWPFTDFFTGEQFPVNPAIVHAMRSKKALISDGMSAPPGLANAA